VPLILVVYKQVFGFSDLTEENKDHVLLQCLLHGYSIYCFSAGKPAASKLQPSAKPDVIPSIEKDGKSHGLG
jgi:hypothetical protein